MFGNEHIIDLAVLEYHGWWGGAVPLTDPFWQADSVELRPRVTFVGADYSPHFRFDGIGDGGSSPGNWGTLLASRLATDAPLTMEPSVTYDAGTRTGTFTAHITNVSAGTILGQYRIMITENDIYLPSPNGEVWHDWTVRDMVDTHLGVAVNLSAGEDTTIAKVFTLGVEGAPASGWEHDNVQIVGFVQNTPSKEIYQGTRIFYPFDLPFVEISAATTTEQITLSGDGDAYLDPGETGNVVIELANLNLASALSASATISTSDPYLSITDGSASYGTIAGNSTADNSGNPFVVVAALNAPHGHRASVDMSVTATGYSKALTFTVPIGSPTDPIGPDGGNYYAYESGDVSDPENPTYSWFEINPALGGSGTLVSLPDDADTRFILPFMFRWYGANKDSITISSNGWIAIGRYFTTGGDNSPSRIPDPDGPGGLVAGMWTDLDPSAIGPGDVYRYYDLANHRYIVEFDRVEHFQTGGGGLPETFQFLIYDPAFNPTVNGDGEVIIQYKDVNLPTDVVSGVENIAETVGIEYNFFNILNPSSQGIADLRAVRYTPDPPTVATSVGGETPGASRVMLAAAPNPMRQGTTLRYSLPQGAEVRLRVFTVDGRLVATLVNGMVEAGRHEVRWDAQAAGKPLSSGIYFARLETRGETLVEKLILTR